MLHKTSHMIYGDTGDGKTALAASWARAIHRRTGKKIRYYTYEPAGVMTLQDVIGDGILEVMDLTEFPFPTETIDAAANGGWFGEDGSLKKPLKAALAESLKDVGGLAYEGGTSFADAAMQELCVAGADNKILNAEAPPQRYQSGGLKIAGANQSMYGMIQRSMKKAIDDSHRMPVHILWTFREKQVEDKREVSGFREIYGPLLIGNALTPHIPAWFGRTIHVDTVNGKDSKGALSVEKRAFLKTHFYEGDKAPFIANLRVPPRVVDNLPESIIMDRKEGTFETILTMIEKELAAPKN